METETGIENKRQLATIQRIDTLRPIEGADKIVVATMESLGWECVVKRDEFKIGDLIVYLEVDSQCPERSEFEFLRERKFRVKTIKLRKQVSQGLIMPLSILPKDIKVGLGMDVSEILGITKHDPQLKKESEETEGSSSKTKVPKWLMNIWLFRKIYFWLNPNVRGNWPVEHVGGKTDETRIQVCAKRLVEHYNEEWYVAEKLDGSSCSFFTYMSKIWGVKRKVFGVCSRNIFLKTKINCFYWRLAEKTDIEKKLLKEKDLIVIQGEGVGPSIQKNKYKLSDIDLYIFNLKRNGVLSSVDDMVSFCELNGLKHVPIVNSRFIPSISIGENKSTMDIVRYMVEMSKGKSQLYDRNREGIVCRLISDPTISFKVINPDFLLEIHGED